MKTSASQRAKIGLFTLVGIAILLAGIFVIGSKRNIFGNTFTVYGTFKNVGGLQIGNNVRFAGINIGTVQNIAIVNDTTVRVDFILQNKVRPFIKKNTVATVGSDGLMGDKLVTLVSNGEAADLLPEGGRLATQNPVEYDKILGKFTDIANNAEMLTSDLAGIFNQINQGKGSLGRLLYSDNLVKNLEGTVSSANKTLNTVQQGAQATLNNVQKGVTGFNENMDAAKHSFLLRGYFKKKERAKQEKIQQQQDSVNSKKR